jgi:hypothetical protein
LLAGLLVASTPAACGRPHDAELTERLWVSELPKNPRQTIGAFVISHVKNRELGVFYRGSVYRGAHDVFRFRGVAGGAKGTLQLLQDGASHEVHTQTCTPDRGFDHCILLHGDPTGVVRYQSRKRWSLRKKDTEPLDLALVLEELAEGDEDLQALVEAARTGEE